jgi:mevalonate kinase
MTTAYAPGKIILFGEHAVVYGRPALAVPVTQVQTVVTVSESPRPGVWIDAPGISLYSELYALAAVHPLAAAIQQVFSTLQIACPPACTIQIKSTIPVAAGLGSGAAVSVAILRALSAYLHAPLPDERVNELAFEVEKLHHGTPSGIDNAVVTFARPVYFVKDRPIKTLRVGAAFTIVIADTGISAPTKESVAAVRSLWEADPARWETVFDRVGEIASQARQAMENGEIAKLGRLMNANHALLQEMTVSCMELDHLVEKARLSGALGAKLSGGGRGGNMLALVPGEKSASLAQALLSAGARRVITTTVQPNQRNSA